MSSQREYPLVSALPGATLTDIMQIDVTGLDAVMFDIENAGSAALTSWALLARVSRNAPFRAITPSSIKAVDGSMIVRAGAVEVATLGANAWVQFGLNVALYESIAIRAAGVGAQLKIAAGGLA